MGLDPWVSLGALLSVGAVLIGYIRASMRDLKDELKADIEKLDGKIDEARTEAKADNQKLEAKIEKLDTKIDETRTETKIDIEKLDTKIHEAHRQTKAKTHK